MISRVLALPESEVAALVARVLEELSPRHHEFRESLLERFAKVWALQPTDQEIDEQRKLLIASFFYAEYAIESAALFNPSIVPHPPQAEVPEGSLRVVLSLRATGEGLSSITFRTGLVDPKGVLSIDPPSPFVEEPEIIPNPLYERPLFRRKLDELGLTNSFTGKVVDRLAATFTLSDLRQSLEEERKERRRAGLAEEATASPSRR